jgi:hypothetical protein
MRFGGTTMSIILTDLSRASALGNLQKGCSKRPQAHSPSEPKKGGPSHLIFVCMTLSLKSGAWPAVQFSDSSIRDVQCIMQESSEVIDNRVLPGFTWHSVGAQRRSVNFNSLCS